MGQLHMSDWRLGGSVSHVWLEAGGSVTHV